MTTQFQQKAKELAHTPASELPDLVWIHRARLLLDKIAEAESVQMARTGADEDWMPNGWQSKDKRYHYATALILPDEKEGA